MHNHEWTKHVHWASLGKDGWECEGGGGIISAVYP